MKSSFIDAVRRMVERSHPPQIHSSTPGSVQLAHGPRLRPTTVQGLAVRKQLPEDGWEVAWEAVPGASSYEIQTNPEPGRLLRWFERGRVKGTQAEIHPRSQAGQVWLRVRACSMGGTGPWSDPILLKRRKGEIRRAA